VDTAVVLLVSPMTAFAACTVLSDEATHSFRQVACSVVTCLRSDLTSSEIYVKANKEHTPVLLVSGYGASCAIDEDKANAK
jgi:hypothetical protein